MCKLEKLYCIFQTMSSVSCGDSSNSSFLFHLSMFVSMPQVRQDLGQVVNHHIIRGILQLTLSDGTVGLGPQNGGGDICGQSVSGIIFYINSVKHSSRKKVFVSLRKLSGKYVVDITAHCCMELRYIVIFPVKEKHDRPFPVPRPNLLRKNLFPHPQTITMTKNLTFILFLNNFSCYGSC